MWHITVWSHQCSTLTTWHAVVRIVSSGGLHLKKMPCAFSWVGRNGLMFTCVCATEVWTLCQESWVEEHCSSGSAHGYVQDPARLSVPGIDRRAFSAAVRCPSPALGQRGRCRWCKSRGRRGASPVKVSRGHARLQDTRHRPVRLEHTVYGDGGQCQRSLQRHAAHDVRYAIAVLDAAPITSLITLSSLTLLWCNMVW